MKTKLLLLTMAVLPAFATQVYDYRSQANEALGTFPNFGVWGQVFTAPAGASELSEFAFLSYIINPAPFKSTVFYPYVMAWDGAEATGSILYQGSLTTMVEQYQPPTEYDQFPNIPVTPGEQYVFFISGDQADESTGGSVYFEHVTPNPYSGGNAVAIHSSNFSDVTGTPWTVEPDTALAFELVFDAVPEPSSWLLMSTALGLLVYFCFGRTSRISAADVRPPCDWTTVEK